MNEGLSCCCCCCVCVREREGVGEEEAPSLVCILFGDDLAISDNFSYSRPKICVKLRPCFFSRISARISLCPRIPGHDVTGCHLEFMNSMFLY